MYQHYIPQVYLKQFVDPETPEGHEPFLHVWDLETLTLKRRAPRNVAGKTDFYETEGVTGGSGAGIEKRLSRIEAHFEKALVSIQNGVAAVDEGLHWFLATLCVRTPWAKRAIEEHQRQHDHPALDPRELWASSIEYLSDLWVREYFTRMEWLLIGPEDPTRHFVTSDNPVALTSDSMDGGVLDVLRLTERSAVVTVPLSPSLGLVGSYRRSEFLDSGIAVDWVNDRTITSATRFVFMSGAEVWAPSA